MLSPTLQPPHHPGQAVKELQTSTREAIVLLKAMIEEVRNSASEEEAAINSLFSCMQVRALCPQDRARALGRGWGGCRTQGGCAFCRSSSPRGKSHS